MAFVMITIMYPRVTMMVEIAVHLMEIIGMTIAKHVNVSSLLQYQLQQQLKLAWIFGLRKHVKSTRTGVLLLPAKLRNIARVLANFAKNQ